MKLNRFLQNEIGVQFPDLVANLQREIMQSKGEKLSTAITNLNKIILQELNIQTPIMLSSDFERNLKHGEDKIIEIEITWRNMLFKCARGKDIIF